MAKRAGLKRRKRPKLTRRRKSFARAGKYVALNDRLYDYVVRHRSRAVDPLLDELRAETEALGDIARMLISREQGDFLTLLTRLLEVRTAVEVGTFTGYSSICIARGLARNGRLTCFDTSEEWTGIAQRYWTREVVAKKIELRLGDAAIELPRWKSRKPIDLAFIDANKSGYDTYFELLLPRMKSNGLFIFDNMVWGGRIIEQPLADPDSVAIDQLNKKLAADSRVDSVLLPIADGLHLARKK
jgi:caffeoyl-CoA O-methyltransferase